MIYYSTKFILRESADISSLVTAIKLNFNTAKPPAISNTGYANDRIITSL
jgi:hypothetical protein